MAAPKLTKKQREELIAAGGPRRGIYHSGGGYLYTMDPRTRRKLIKLGLTRPLQDPFDRHNVWLMPAGQELADKLIRARQ